ncbi:MAG: SDR family oxidoreductase [Nocardioidaceae bacterium]
MTDSRLCLVTGATGYVGGRLVPELLAAGHRVRILARTPSKLTGRSWRDDVEVVRGSADEGAVVSAAMSGIDVAYYLVPVIGTTQRDSAGRRDMARTFAATARTEDVGRIVHLSGLDPARQRLGSDVVARSEVSQGLLESGVPTVALQAGLIIGSGSASFEMLRYLTERLPVMVTPRWVHTRIQPIAIRDVLRYLVACATIPDELNRTFDIAGPDTLTYLDLMQGFARVAGLTRRRIVQVPVTMPRLSTHWVNLVTPVPRALARPLVASLRGTAVASEHDIAAYVPDPPDGLIGYERALELALSRIQDLDVPTSWSSATTAGAPSEPLPSDPDWAGGSLYVDDRARSVAAPPAALWTIIEGIGGRRGWYSFALGWQVRGWIDRLTGGPGLVRGRRDPDHLLAGDSLDWWRVEEVDPGLLLRLRAEMRLPGLAWLELSITPADEQGQKSVFHQRALFHPRGIAGHAYWWAVWPFHGIVFGSMQRNIARAAEQLVQTEREPADSTGDDSPH